MSGDGGLELALPRSRGHIPVIVEPLISVAFLLPTQTCFRSSWNRFCLNLSRLKLDDFISLRNRKVWVPLGSRPYNNIGFHIETQDTGSKSYYIVAFEDLLYRPSTYLYVFMPKQPVYMLLYYLINLHQHCSSKLKFSGRNLTLTWHRFSSVTARPGTIGPLKGKDASVLIIGPGPSQRTTSNTRSNAIFCHEFDRSTSLPYSAIGVASIFD